MDVKIHSYQCLCIDRTPGLLVIEPPFVPLCVGFLSTSLHTIVNKIRWRDDQPLLFGYHTVIFSSLKL